MADFVNPVSLDLVASVNDMPAPWVVCTRSNLELWQAIPRLYRKWVVDQVMEMDAGEKASADAAALTAQRDSAAAQFNQTEDVLRAFMLLVVDELNAHAAKTNSILDAIDAATSLADLKTRVGVIANLPARTAQQLRNAIRGKLGS